MTTAEHMAHALAQAEIPHTPWEHLDRDTRISARIRAVGILNALDAGSPRRAADREIADGALDLINRHGAHCTDSVRDALQNLWEVADAVCRY